ncbi:MAG: transcription termination factor NusA [Bacteroidetes bacterium]|nr:transcription termination factor NusA [Bacteroidota bacterium]
MAIRKKQKIDKAAIVAAFSEMAKVKKIDKDLLQGLIEETLSLMVKRKYGNQADFEIIVNMEKGDIELYLIKTIVENVEDSSTQITLEEARKRGGDDYKDKGIGDEFIEEITLENISENFGRRLISFASQTMNSKIREIERDNIYNDYKDKIGEVITGEIHQIRKNEIIVSHNRMEMKLPRTEQIPNEMFKTRKNKNIRALIKDVTQTLTTRPEIILTRRTPEFLAKLLEIEVPEIYDGLIQIKSIARFPGERSKVAISSVDDRIDAIGACVGVKGVRINAIMQELNHENIDLIYYSDNVSQFIKNALAPAVVKDIIFSSETKIATVVVPDEYVSAAIGKNGQNVKLASQVTGYDIRLLKEGSEDIDIREFDIEIGKEAVERLVENNINTAREFLEVSPEILLSIEGLNYDIIIDARKAMLIEFDEDEDENYINLLKQAANYSAEEDPDKQVDNIEDSNIVAEQEKEEQTSEDITENTEEVDEKENE